MKVGFFDQTWVSNQRKKTNPQKFTNALTELLSVANPYGTNDGKVENPEEIECCICINAIAPFQALFISPCSHIYHHKCVAAMISKSPMFQCPLCRQVANLTASVSSEALDIPMEEVMVKMPEKYRTDEKSRTEGSSSVPTATELAAALQPIAATTSRRRSLIPSMFRRLSVTAVDSVQRILKLTQPPRFKHPRSNHHPTPL
jgi:RING-like zinc finger